jgi:AcrR family transcriptional regulator
MVQPPTAPVSAAGAHFEGAGLVPPSPLPPSTKEQLVVTAERLFAVHGIDSVSLRQICADAGNANNSAVQYHFGTKDRLLQAIFEYRIPHLMARRNLLAAEASANGSYDDIRTALMVQFLPLVEQAETEGSYYLGFVTQLNHQRAGDHPYWRLPAEYRTNVERYRVHLHELLSDLPPTLRWHRIQIADAALTQACAAREQARYLGGTPTLPYGFHVEALFDALTGILTAPVSPTAAKVANTLDLGNLAPFYPDIKPPPLQSRPVEP